MVTNEEFEEEVGKVAWVERVTIGDSLTEDTASGATVLNVFDCVNFSEAGGQLSIYGDLYGYTGIDDEAGIIYLAEPTTNDYEEGDFLQIEPRAEEVYAHVQVSGEDDSIRCVVPQNLRDRLAEGIRQEWKAETVSMTYNGSNFEIDDILSRPLVVDGSFIDPETLPEMPAPEPVAPEASPTPVGKALGLGAIRWSWTPITNPTPVMYDIYQSSTTPVDYQNPNNLLESTSASSLSTSTQPDGTALEDGVTYHAVIVARSEDEYGPASGEGSAQIIVLDISDDLDNLQGQLDGLDTALDGLNTELGTLGSTVVTINDTTIPAIQGDVAGVTSDLETVTDTTIPAIQSDVSTVADDVDTITGTTIPGIQSDLSDLATEVGGILPITETDIADDSISTPKLKANSVTTNALAAGSVTTNEVATRTLTAENVALRSLTGEELAANSVSTNELVAGEAWIGTVSANRIEGTEASIDNVLSADIATAASGERTGISAERGLYSEGPDGEEVLRAQGGNLRIAGEVEATALSVTGSATWAGDNVGAPGASTTMADRLSPPATAPTVTAVYDTITLDGADVVGDYEEFRSGLVWHDNHWWVVSKTNYFTDGGWLSLLKFDASGTFVAKYSNPGTSETIEVPTLTMLGSKFYAYVFASYGFNYVCVWSATGTSSGILEGIPREYESTLGNDGTDLIFAWRDGNNNCRWQKYDTSGNKVGSEVDTGSNIIPNALLSGSFDLGANRIVIAGPNFTNVLTTSGSSLPNYRFRSPGARGLAWDGSNFYTLANPTTIRMHTGALSGSGADVGLYTSATWYDSDLTGGPHETESSPIALRTFTARAKHRFQTSAKVPGLGGSDDPNGARFYVGREQSSVAYLELQGMDDPGVGERPELIVSSIALPPFDSTAANHPPFSGNFAGGSTPYRHFAQSGGFEIDGASNGSVGTGTFRDSVLEVVKYGLVLPWIHYNNAAGTSIPHNEFKLVPWPGASVDNSGTGDFSYLSDGRIQVLSAGVYEISTQVSIAMPSGNRLALRITYKNNDPVAFAGDHSSNGGYGTVRIAGFKQRMAMGSWIGVEVHQNSGSSQLLVANGAHNWIQLTRVHA